MHAWFWIIDRPTNLIGIKTLHYFLMSYICTDVPAIRNYWALGPRFCPNFPAPTTLNAAREPRKPLPANDPDCLSKRAYEWEMTVHFSLV